MSDYNFVTIELNIDKDNSLMILLHKDGTINRKGDGSYRIQKTIYMGMVDKPIFDELMSTITDDFKRYLGKVYDLPDKKGKTCSVEITLGSDNGGTGMKFIYGSKSIGPPDVVATFVEEAIHLTNPWFKKQQPPKKWWQFWLP